MRKEISYIKVIDLETNEVLKNGFHDEFDALEWLEAQGKTGKFLIRTDRHIVL